MIKLKKPVRVILGILGFAVCWAGAVAFIAWQWRSFMASQIIMKYEVTGFLPQDVVLMGSSTTQAWLTSAADLGPLHSENVGIGGTVVREWFPLVDKLVVPFNPRAVIVYLGANDLHGGEFRGPDETAEDMARLLEQIHGALPAARIYYISVYTSGSLPQLKDVDDQMNRLMEALAARTDYLRFIDIAHALRDSGDQVRGDLFRHDQVHLNTEGYRIVSGLVRDVLFADLAVGK